jgi:mycofactocin system glycosyltransferase
MVGVSDSRRYVVDSSYRRPGNGTTIVAGSPLRLFRIAARGASTLVALERGDEPPPGSQALVDRLVDAGAIHPCPVRRTGRSRDAARDELTVVIPAQDDVPRYRPGRCRTIVVDDASREPLRAADAEVLRLDANVGPGGARNAGLGLAHTPFVAFVDTDVDVDEEALLALLDHFDDARVALVAPRVLGDPAGVGPLARYEAVRSPLDLGSEPGRVAPGSRVAFVPAAAVLVRVEAVRRIGGFDAALRYGEDVDLAWRLAEAGWRCRYDPSVTVRHATRPTLLAWLAQRVRYGTSAAPLADRHPGALAPVRMSGWSAATWSAVAVGAPIVGATIAVGTTFALVRKLRDLPAAESLRLAGLGHVYAGRLLVATLLRAWWPVAALLGLLSRRARRVLAAAAIASALADWRRERPAMDPLTYVVLRRLDDLAYGAGVWVGAIRRRDVAALLPALSNWPPRDAPAPALASPP